MTDFLLPPDLALAKATIGLDANTSAFSSPTVGSTRTIERLGDRLRINFDFTITNDNVNTARQRGRMQAFLKKLRGQASRVYLSPPGAAQRGSFPAPELLSNNTFANGTTGWAAVTAQSALSAQDRILRVKRVGPGNYLGASQGPVASINVPYAARAMYVYGGSGPTNFHLQLSSTANVSDTAFVGNYLAIGWVPSGISSTSLLIYETSPTGGTTGDVMDIPWASVSRCALIDNISNLFLWSDDLSNAAWGKSACSITTNAAVAADGTTSADAIVDTAVNTTHYVFQSATCGAATQAITGYATLENAAKNWAFMQIYTATGICAVFVNLSTGALGTVTTGTGWLDARATLANVGGNKYRLCLTAFKTSADTTVSMNIGPASADTVIPYLGTAVAATFAWRAGICLSSTATIGAQTGSVAASTPAGQGGTQIGLKGLPVSSAGLLLPGDWVECNGQLNQVVSSLDSDAAGLGIVQLARPFRNSPANEAPFIVNNPMGKFMVNSNSTSWNEQPGSISDASVEFIEDISF